MLLAKHRHLVFVLLGLLILASIGLPVLGQLKITNLNLKDPLTRERYYCGFEQKGVLYKKKNGRYQSINFKKALLKLQTRIDKATGSHKTALLSSLQTLADAKRACEQKFAAYKKCKDKRNCKLPNPTRTPTPTATATSSPTPVPTVVSTPSNFIHPGNGFAGPTEAPSPVGDPTALGYDEKAIARWNVVPYQTFSENFNVGVLAFHMNDISHVSFSVNGGAWREISTVRLNTQTGNPYDIGEPSAGTNEYFATLRATDFTSDGPIEVRAIAYPKIGIPRVLETLYLNSNASNTLVSPVAHVAITGSDTTGNGTKANPYATILRAINAINSQYGAIGGATIYLGAGSYYVPSPGHNPYNSDHRWLTITKAPELSRSDVTILGSSNTPWASRDGINTKLLKISNVRLTNLVVGSADRFVAKAYTAVWYDGTELSGPGRYAGQSFRDYQSNHRFTTNSYIHDMQDVPDGMDIQRNLRVERIAQSGFHNTLLVVNSSLADSIHLSGDGLHPDVYQFTGPVDNAILFGVTATDKIYSFCIRMQPSAKNVAVVNYHCELKSGYGWELERPYQHILLKDSIYKGGFFYEDVPPQTFSAKNVVFDNVSGAEHLPPYPGVIFKNMNMQ